MRTLIIHPFILNLIIAFVWTMLSDSPGLITFAFGFFLGFLLMAMFHRLFGETYLIKSRKARYWDYIRETKGFFLFLIWFVWEFILASWNVVRIILFKPKSHIQPQIFTLDIAGMTDFQILFLANTITLTPGSAALQISEDKTMMFVHTIDTKNPDQVRHDIETGLKKRIMEFTK